MKHRRIKYPFAKRLILPDLKYTSSGKHSLRLHSIIHNTEVDVVPCSQLTDPLVLDSLKPQLKLVQASVGDKEVADLTVSSEQ